MKKYGLAALILVILSFCTISVRCAEIKKESKTYALIVSGISKDTQDKITKALEVSSLHNFLQKRNQAAPEMIKLLTAEETQKNSEAGSQRADIEKILSQFESVINSEDRFIFYYTGQANPAGNQLRFNLSGEDITHHQLSMLLKNIKASSILIVLDCPASGMAVKTLSGTGRIIICGCTEEQRFATKLSEFFVPALSNSETDIDKNGKISILEAFISTSRQIEEWYRTRKLIITETPILDDNGDGKASKEPWRYMLDVKDGLNASEFFL